MHSKYYSPQYEHKFGELRIFQAEINIPCHFSHSYMTLPIFIYSFYSFHLRGVIPQCEHKWCASLAAYGSEEGWQVHWMDPEIEGEALATRLRALELADLNRTPDEKKGIS